MMSQPNSSECIGENHDFPAAGPTTGPRSLKVADPPIDADLGKIVSAWKNLAQPLKRALLALIDSPGAGG